MSTFKCYDTIYSKEIIHKFQAAVLEYLIYSTFLRLFYLFCNIAINQGLNIQFGQKIGNELL